MQRNLALLISFINTDILAGADLVLAFFGGVSTPSTRTLTLLIATLLR
jgi:hypothetical protein